MDFALTEEQEFLRQDIRDFAASELSDNVIDRDHRGEFSRELWRRSASKGLTGLPAPEEYGGAGLDPLTVAIVMEALGYGCPDGGHVFSLGGHNGTCIIPITKYGSEEQKQRYLPRLCTGELIGANGMTELRSGSDAYAMTTTAEACDGGFRINGGKMFITNSSVANLIVVYALTDERKRFFGGITAFLVDTDTPGFTAAQTFEKMGLRTAPVGELVFDDMFVPESAVLGRIGAGAMIFGTVLDYERTCLFASHTGQAEKVLETAAAYARTRKQTGKPIGSYQAISHRLAELKTRLEAARLLVYRAAWMIDRDRNVNVHAAMAKNFMAETLIACSMAAVHTLGGYGYMTEYEVERTLRDAVSAPIYSGTTEIQNNIIARSLGL
jgi:alkylation response protein AidB-like acyl-CoA dehydrogenase